MADCHLLLERVVNGAGGESTPANFEWVPSGQGALKEPVALFSDGSNTPKRPTLASGLGSYGIHEWQFPVGLHTRAFTVGPLADYRRKTCIAALIADLETLRIS